MLTIELPKEILGQLSHVGMDINGMEDDSLFVE